MGDYSFNASKLKKKPPPKPEGQKAADALAEPSPAASPSPSPSPSPAASPKPKYQGTFKPASSDTTETKSVNDATSGTGRSTVTTQVSSTPALDAKKKAERLKTLGDDEVKQKAADGDFEARTEADRRGIQYK